MAKKINVPLTMIGVIVKPAAAAEKLPKRNRLFLTLLKKNHSAVL